ncbi:hypothetical protein PYDG_00017 [Pseudoalteromonas phage pYD6-A]|uniref:Uncharacterized protein n=1 Tax=Pseudoalteromonas phage pYD6-A TaxID=754052 RepID=M4T3V3_9CAUD|nr:hypothetical protein PYDG_00017 [Pseudoalteromonas phage pYD6-A]AGH57549.1 hypothetical protein PYDG_00017 [Pseudoalteromonas phage pYD6-A]
MLFAHFTSEGHANSVHKGITRFPFHLTTDLERGVAYGSHAVVFKVSGEFICKINKVTCNKYANGMIEYVIRNELELRSFMEVVEASGVRHCIQLRGVNQ